MIRKTIVLLTLTINLYPACAQNRHSLSSSFPSYKGLVMAGYHGWFNAPGDGANMGWNHYATGGKFEPGFCKIDFWPDMSEYEKKYETPFRLKNGIPASVFSCYDSQTVAIHFKWMKDYGIDGVFIQRSVTSLKDSVKLANENHVLANVLSASRKFHRAIAVMYDFSGLDGKSEDWDLIIKDWKTLVDVMHIAGNGDQQTYLFHHGKPLVGIWGVGFPERSNDLKKTEQIIQFLKNDPVYGGCSILLGVPAYWRDFGSDTEKDPYLHDLLREIDILRPWFVGRFTDENYSKFRKRMYLDMQWCKQNNIDYVPVIFPGFSWHNMHPESLSVPIPRNRGRFYWKQLTGAIKAGSEMLYIAMFDEMDEGTSIFKTTNNPPVGPSKFESFEQGIPTDYYLYLSGMAAKILKNSIPFKTKIPLPVDSLR